MTFSYKWLNIVAVIAWTAFFGIFQGSLAEDKMTKAAEQMGELDTAIQEYYGLTVSYPMLLEHLLYGPEEYRGEWRSLIVKEALNDPWGVPYILIYDKSPGTSDNALSYQLVSAGPDGKFDTGDDLFFLSEDRFGAAAIIE